MPHRQTGAMMPCPRQWQGPADRGKCSTLGSSQFQEHWACTGCRLRAAGAGHRRLERRTGPARPEPGLGSTRRAGCATSVARHCGWPSGPLLCGCPAARGRPLWIRRSARPPAQTWPLTGRTRGGRPWPSGRSATAGATLPTGAPPRRGLDQMRLVLDRGQHPTPPRGMRSSKTMAPHHTDPP